MYNFKKINLIICLIVSVFISIFQMLGRFLDVRSGEISISLVRIVIEGLLFFILCFIIIILLWRSGQKAVMSKPLTHKVFLNIWFWQLIILITWLPCFLAYFPGIYSYDGEPQLIQYTSGKLDNHHPIIHTLILGKCYDLGRWQELLKTMIMRYGQNMGRGLQIIFPRQALACMVRFER